MNSTAWNSSAFILTWDEADGFYDHVLPYPIPVPDDISPIPTRPSQPDDFTLSGFRVPLIVGSPRVKENHVSHVNREFTLILKLIQACFRIADTHPARCCGR